MVFACIVPGCKNRRSKEDDRSFHCFPFSDPHRCDIWINAIFRGEKLKSWKPSIHARVCSDHFVPDDYCEGTRIRTLKDTAVPSKFPPGPTRSPSPPKDRTALGLQDEQGGVIPPPEGFRMDVYRRRLIKLVQARPMIWNPANPDYKNEDQLNRVWEYIDTHLKPRSGVYVNARATWALLTRRFSDSLRRGRKRSDSGPDSEKEWKFKKQMMFLLPVMQLSLSTGSFSYVGQERSCGHISTDSQDLDTNDSTESQTVTVKLESAVEEDSYMYIVPGTPAQDNPMLTSTPQEGNSDSTDTTPKHTQEETQGVNKRRREEARVDIATPNQLKQRPTKKSKESPRLNFFRSIMETVDSLDENQFMNFQIDVIQALKDQKAGRQQARYKQPKQYMSMSQNLGASTSTDSHYVHNYPPENNG